MAKRPKIPKVPSGDMPENAPLMERGQKARAGRVLSEYLRAVAQEVTEVVQVETRGADNKVVIEPRLMSKAESLARWLWFKAVPRKDDDGNMVPPDLDVVKLVLDRVEGKAGTQGKDEIEEKESVPDRISRMNAERVNRIAEEVTQESGE